MTPQRTRRAGIALVLATMLVVAAPAGGVPAGADPISEKRAEAERIAAELAEQNRRLSILTEDFDEARVKAAELEGEAAAAEQHAARTDEQMQGVRRRVQDQAVAAYVMGGATHAIELLMRQSGVDRAGIGKLYAKTVTSTSLEDLDELRAARLRLDEERARLDAARSAAQDALDRVDSTRRAATAARSAQQQTLAKVQGEVAELVAAEARRKAEEEARRVQAELALRREREAAAAREREAAAAREREAAARARLAASTTSTTVPRPPSPTAARPPVATTVPVAPSGSLPPPAKGAAEAVAEAKRQLGKPYEWGADGPDSFDCSGLTQWAWKAGGRYLPHSSRAQWSVTTRVPVGDVQPGDLLFYGDPIHHVGIYAGDGMMVEASETGTPVRMATIYRRDLVGVGRVY